MNTPTFTTEDLNRAVETATAYLKAELRQANKENGELAEQVSMLKYAFKGLCGETLHLHVDISAKELLNPDSDVFYLRTALEHGARILAEEALRRFEDTHKLHREIADLKRHVGASYFQKFEYGRQR